MSHDMKERKCGCVYFEFGPPVLCGKHQSKVAKKEKRAKVREEKGLRKLVIEQSTAKGHDLSRFKEYGSMPGKWVAHCHSCGGLVIVYDKPREFGDQISGPALFADCQKSETLAALRDSDRAAFANRFAPGEQPDAGSDDEDSSEGPDDSSVDPSELSVLD